MARSLENEATSATVNVTLVAIFDSSRPLLEPWSAAEQHMLKSYSASFDRIRHHSTEAQWTEPPSFTLDPKLSRA